MKKILSMILIIAVIASAVAVFTLPAAAASDNTLTVTCYGQNLGEVEVGNEFIFNVALNSAGYSPFMGQGEVYYNSKYVELVPYGPLKKDGSVNMDAYCFPSRIRNTSLVTNYQAAGDKINYNFAKGNSGVGEFTTADHYFKVRFKAIAPGTVEIRHYLNTLSSMVGNKLYRLIYLNQGNDQLDPIPYTEISVEPAAAFIGDADGDYNLTVMDATFIQRVTAGVDSSYKLVNADVNEDGEVNLRDALQILRFKAGLTTDTKVGEWIFNSELA